MNRLRRSKKGVEAFVFVFSFLLLVIFLIAFIVGVNYVKTPEKVIKRTIEHSDSKLLIHAILKHEIPYEESTLSIQEAVFLYSENDDSELEKEIRKELDKLILPLYEEPCWELNMEKGDDSIEIDNYDVMSFSNCWTKSIRVDVDFLAPSRRGILEYNLVIEE